MSMAAIGIAGIAISAGATAYGLSGAGQPTQPNLASSSKQLSDTEAQLLPIQRGIQAAAQEGGDYSFSLPPGVDPHQYGFDQLPQGTSNANQTQVFVPNVVNPGGLIQKRSPLNPQGPGGGGQWVPYNAADWQNGGKYANFGTPKLRDVTNKNGTYTVSFKGYGAGDTQRQIAEQSAAGQLALAQKYDPQFIANALKEEKQADPNSFAARQRMSELIQQQITDPPSNPIAGELSGQVGAQLKAGRGLDEFDTGVLNDAVSKALADRNSSGQGADFSMPLTTGAAGVNRELAGQQKALGDLTSGTTPEDVQYRQEQQNLANLSAEINGQTPQSQFKSLSGAQQGPTPQVSGPSLPLIPGNTMQTAGNAALQANSTALGVAAQQANPWLSGISTTLAGLNAAGDIGWQPFGKKG